MQCAPHTPYPHCTEPHCVPLFTPHPASKWQITTTEGGEKMNEDEWMQPSTHHHPHFACTPSPPPCFSLHYLHTSQPASLYMLSTAGLCYDCSWCVITHIAVSTAPPWGHPYKGLSFPKVRSEPCTQVLSRHLVWRGKKKKKNLLAHTLCLSVCSGHDYWGQCLGCPFCLFVFSLLLLSSILSLLLYRKSVCAAYVFAAKGEAAVTSWYACVFLNTKG